MVKQLRTRGTFVALFVLAILALFLVKLPTWLLDLLLVANLFLAMTLLLKGIYSERGSLIYSFPTVLVLATLFRLGLNVSSTKLILLEGDQGLDAAGRVIQSFGTFVVSGDFVVGFILFGIIAIVNFVVIAKGSARVAEVAARFSLDSLPGRQLSIDSDLRNESIASSAARQQRDELDRQSQFFGSMDGAMKWVQGDAIAGFVITCINAVGGVSIGVTRGMSFSDAINTFGILTIGDGLLSILPSLLISVAAGIVVTNSTGNQEEDSAEQLVTQLFSDPRAPILAAVTLLLISAFGVVGLADFPVIPFFLLGSVTLVLLWVYRKESSTDKSSEQLDQLSGWPLALPQGQQRKPGQVVPLLIELDPLALGPLVTSNGSRWGREFWTFAEQYSRDFLVQYGVALPQPLIRINQELSEGEYRIVVRDRTVRKGELNAGTLFVNTSESVPKIYGASIVSTVKHPISNRQCAWIRSQDEIERALGRLGVALVTPVEFLWLDAVGATLESIDDVIGSAEVKQLIAMSESSVGELVSELIESDKVTLPEIAEVFRRLARERVSIRDVKRLIEAIAEFAVLSPREANRRLEWLQELQEFLRVVVIRGVLQECQGGAGVLRTFLLSKDVEDEFSAAVSLWDRMRTPPPLDPLEAQNIRESAVRLFGPAIERGALPIVIVCSSEVRVAVQEFFARVYGTADWFRTLSYEEVSMAENVELVSVLNMSV